MPCHGKLDILSYKLSSYCLALRPWTFTASVTPVLLGTVLAYKHALFLTPSASAPDHFSATILALTLLISLATHGAGNLVNSYYDFLLGVDALKGPAARDRTLLDRVLAPPEVVNLAGFLYLAACAALLALCRVSPARTEHLALLFFGGMSGSFLYTGGGVGLKYFAGLGDLVAALVFGPVCVSFGYLAHSGRHASLLEVPLVYSLPLFAAAIAVAHAANSVDAFLSPPRSRQRTVTFNTPLQLRVTTFAHVIGPILSAYLYAAALLSPYAMFLYLSITRHSFWFLLPSLTLFKSLRSVKRFSQSLNATSGADSRDSYFLNEVIRKFGLLFSVFSSVSDSYSLSPTLSNGKATAYHSRDSGGDHGYLPSPLRISTFNVENIPYKTAKLNFEMGVYYVLACYLAPSKHMFQQM
ncbi:unnamed protein product [Gordionus sp. m RMFG-2023]|uniref:ubiA prenyltransferase domain-containing protein 1-like n=1 Tax=Gordionus sp. m RMFG-2023 TaxID=3053472 RepID=UPI0030E12D51